MYVCVVFLSEDEKEAQTEKNRGKKSLSRAAIWVSSHSSVSAEKNMTEVWREGVKCGECRRGEERTWAEKKKTELDEEK